jgi:GT2 family glycosyltransferase
LAEDAVTEWTRGAAWVPGNEWRRYDGVAVPPPVVTVVVAHYSQPRQLARTLAALAAQDYPAHLMEVIVADDGSPDSVSVPPDVTLVRQADRGFRLAAVRNLGVRASRGDVLCFLDADTAPEPGYVRALTRLPALLPEAVTVGRRRHADFHGSDPDVPLSEATQGRELPEPSWLRREYARSDDLSRSDDRTYRFVIGAVMACSRTFFDEVGGFDEEFTAYGGEDWEWAHRAWQAGAVFAHVAEAIAWHDGPDWAGRRGSDISRANAQTLRLASMIEVPGSSGRGLAPTLPDVVVHLRGEHSEAAVFICVDSILAAFPRARVLLDVAPETEALRRDERVRVAEPFDPRIRWTLDAPVIVDDPRGLRELLSELSGADVGTIDVVTIAGQHAGVLRSRRAERRAQRWGTEATLATRTARVGGVHLLPAEPRLEPYVGGWGDATALS